MPVPDEAYAHVWRRLHPARNAWATAATVVHVAWLERRDQNPLLWCVPLAAVVALIGPR